MPGRDLDTALHTLHDLTQSVWLGGALMGATSIDAAASVGNDVTARVTGADRAWRRWHRVSTPAIAAHLVAGVGLTYANKGRLGAETGGGRTVAVRSALTGAALLAELSARRIGRQLGERAAAGDGDTDVEVAALHRKLKTTQWATVATTAAMIAVGSRMEEQQRPRELVRGLATRLGLAA